jgi:N-acetylneuraminic acid mutarotase
MLVWGGQVNTGQVNNTGGGYNPTTNTWTTMSTSNAPAARYNPASVWTGSQFIIWGGSNNTGSYFNTGGEYNP